jgi:hypothetical protein
VVTGSCAPGCGPFSPRIIALAVFDPDEFQKGNVSSGNVWANCPTGGSCIHIRNIIGFFVDRMSAGDVIGYLIRYPGLLSSSPGGVGAGSSFNVAITLVR